MDLVEEVWRRTILYNIHTVLHLWYGGANVGQHKLIVELAVVCVKIWC